MGPSYHANTQCDICDADGTHWRCTRSSCEYDLCTSCKKQKSSRRRLLPSMKLGILAKIPNVDADPFEEKDYADVEWRGRYKTSGPGVLLKHIALDVEVSLNALIENNGSIGLAPSCRLRKGTELWIPGAREFCKVGIGVAAARTAHAHL